MLVDFIVHRDLESLHDVLFESLDVFEIISCDESVVHVDPSVYSSRGGCNFHEEAWVVDGLQVTILREVFGVSIIIGALGVWKAVNIFLDG